MKKFRELSEQHREKGRFKPTVPHNVSNTSGGTPRETSDSANVKLREAIKDKVGASKKQETTFHKKLDTLVHKTFGKRKEEMKEAKETGFQKTFRKNTGETYDQYANRRAKEEDERQEQMKKQKEDYIKQGIIKAESVELDEATDHSQMAAMHSAKAQDHGKMAASYHSDTDSSDLADRHMELSREHAKAATLHTKAAKSGNPDHSHEAHEASADVKYLAKQYNESVELDEAMRHEIAGQVARFIGNKIDPVHGDIMHAHGKEAYRQAAYHIRGTIHHVSKAISDLHDKLHRHLRTGNPIRIGEDTGQADARKTTPSSKEEQQKVFDKHKERMKQLAKEEVELDESNKLTLDNILSKGEQINDRIQKHMDAADFHRNQARKIDAKDPNDIEGYNRHASLTDLHAKAFWSLRHHKKSPNGNHLNDYTATHKKIQSRYKKEPQLTKEEVELDEGKYGAFRVGPKRPKYPYVPQGNSDPRTGLPLGFSNPPKSEKPEDKKMKKEEVELDEVSADVAKRVAQARDISAVVNRLTPTQSRRLKMKDSGGEPFMNAAKALKSAMKRGAKNVYGEEVELLDEKNEPTNPELWSRAKTLAKSKFDVYPSAYANGWASKWYKSKGGGWRSVSEETELEEGYFKNQEIERQETERLAKRNEPPFTPDKPKKKSVVVGKKPEGYSRARQLARQAMQKYTTPVKEEKDMSKKAKVVKDIMKKSPDDKFQANPELSNSVTRNL